jgi:hypothetical protein
MMRVDNETFALLYQLFEDASVNYEMAPAGNHRT